MKHCIFALVLFAACSSNPNVKKDLSHLPIVFVGTYTQKLGHVDGKATGIYTCRMDTLTGELTVVDTAMGIANPSFLTVSPNKKYLYAVAENGGKPNEPFGSVVAYKINEGGKLVKINEVSSKGIAPCHVSTNREGTMVFIANYSTGNVENYKVLPDGGLSDTLPVDKIYKDMVWAHMIIEHKNNIYVVDKGADKIYKYLCKYDCNGIGQVNAYKTVKNAGPRHLDFAPNGKFCYVINEINNTMSVFSVNAENGNLTEIESVKTLPEGFAGKNSCAEIQVHPNGKFVYGSNRGHNSIVIFKIDDKTGKLSLVGHQPTQGEIPRSFLITPDGKMLLAANQNSDNVIAFKIDVTTGKLTQTANSRVLTPVCLKML